MLNKPIVVSESNISFSVQTDWNILPIGSSKMLLTEYVYSIIDYCRTYGYIVYEYIYHNSSKVIKTEELDIRYLTDGEIIDIIMREGFIYDVLLYDKKGSFILFASHDLTSILIGEAETLKRITKKTKSVIIKEYQSFIRNWSGQPLLWSNNLIEISKNYPDEYLNYKRISLFADKIILTQ